MAGSNRSLLSIFSDEDIKNIFRTILPKVTKAIKECEPELQSDIIKIACYETINEVLTRFKQTHAIFQKEVPKNGIAD